MPLQPLTAPPASMTQEEHSALQQSTPSTFAGLAPVLRLHLEDVQCSLRPQHVWPDGAGGQATTSTSNGAASSSVTTNGTGSQAGRLWVTDESISFLAASGSGFSLDYPSLSLHAISRTLPLLDEEREPLNKGCVYCQIDLSSGGDEEDEDEDDSLAELWIIPDDEEKVESLFEALSHCASLHPSGGGEDDGGHPFSSFGPFGTGLAGNEQELDRLQSEGAFDDAEEAGNTDEQDVHLSEAGRATLAHLDSLLIGNDAEVAKAGARDDVASSPTASFHSSDPRKAPMAEVTSVAPTNALILVHLPLELFHNPPLAAALLDLLHAYGALRSWTPLPGFGRAVVMYEQTEGAQRAKDALDRLLLPLMDEGDEEASVSYTPEPLRKKDGDNEEGLALRAYYGDPAALARLTDESGAHLLVPETDRNFLISPPGSPPVGWEPIREDPPNTNTLADDLIRALGSLRDRGLGVRSHQPDILGDSSEDAPRRSAHQRTASAATLMPPPSVIIEPRLTQARSHHPRAHEAYAAGDEEGERNGVISLPGVTVQTVESDSDDDDELGARMNKGLSITSVKATVESMRGAPAELSSPSATSSKITPTARPPLGT